MADTGLGDKVKGTVKEAAGGALDLIAPPKKPTKNKMKPRPAKEV